MVRWFCPNRDVSQRHQGGRPARESFRRLEAPLCFGGLETAAPWLRYLRSRFDLRTGYGNPVPDFDFTNETSVEVIAPLAVTSFMKLPIPTGCPDCNLVSETSVESTCRVSGCVADETPMRSPTSRSWVPSFTRTARG